VKKLQENEIIWEPDAKMPGVVWLHTENKPWARIMKGKIVIKISLKV